MSCSDAHVAHVCGQCGGMISVYAHSADYASSYNTTGITNEAAPAKLAKLALCVYIQPPHSSDVIAVTDVLSAY
jgi:hypothetical protein